MDFVKETTRPDGVHSLEQWKYRIFVSSHVQQRKVNRLVYAWGVKHLGWFDQDKVVREQKKKK
jgi:hypothetical protein